MSDTSDIKVEDPKVTCPDEKDYSLTRWDELNGGTTSNPSTSSLISEDAHLNSTLAERDGLAKIRVQMTKDQCDSADGFRRRCSLQELRSNTFQERMQSNLTPISPCVSRSKSGGVVVKSSMLPVDAPLVSVSRKKIRENRKKRAENTKSNQPSSVASKSFVVVGNNDARSNNKPLRSILKRKNANQERSAKLLKLDSIGSNVSERESLGSAPISNERSTPCDIPNPNNAIKIVLASPFLLTAMATNSSEVDRKNVPKKMRKFPAPKQPRKSTYRPIESTRNIDISRSNPIISGGTQRATRVYNTFVKILPKDGARTIPVVSYENVVVNRRRSGDRYRFRKENNPPVNSSIRIDAQVPDKAIIITEENEEKVPVGLIERLQSFPQDIESQALEQVIVLSDSDDDGDAHGDAPGDLYKNPNRNFTFDKQSQRTLCVPDVCSDGILVRTYNDFTLENDDFEATNAESNLRCEEQSTSTDEISLVGEIMSSDEGAVVEDLPSRSKNGIASERKTGCDLLNFLNFTGLEEKRDIKTPVLLERETNRSKKDAEVDISDLVFTLRKICMLCGKMCLSGLPAHLLEKHFDKGEIRTFTESRKGSPIRRQILKDWYLLANYAASVESNYKCPVRQICSICLANVARGEALLHYFQCTSKEIKVDRVPIELGDVLKDLDPLLIKVKKDLTRENFLELSKTLLVSLYILNGELSTVDFLLTTDYHKGREFNGEGNSPLKEMMDSVIMDENMMNVSMVIPQRNCIGMPLFLTSKQMPAADFIAKCRRKISNSYLFMDLYSDFEKRLTIFEALKKYVKIDSLPRTILERFRNHEQRSLANCPQIYKYVPAKYEKSRKREKSTIRQVSGVKEAYNCDLH